MNMELRMHNSELRSNEDGSMTVSGYVNKTGQLSEVLGTSKRFKEKINRGAFERAIQTAKRDIDFLAEHNSKLILASTRNDSLTLREDEQGLFMEARISPTTWGKDYYQLINDGILQNMSFGFRTVKDSWKSIQPGLYERTIDDLELFEVSVVRDPAYSQSTIASRGIDLVEDVEIPNELMEEERAMEEQLKEILQELRSAKEQIEALTIEVRELKSEKEEVRDEGTDSVTSGVTVSGTEKKKEERDDESKEEDNSKADADKKDPDGDGDNDAEGPDADKDEDKKNKERSASEEIAELRNLLNSL